MKKQEIATLQDIYDIIKYERLEAEIKKDEKVLLFLKHGVWFLIGILLGIIICALGSQGGWL